MRRQLTTVVIAGSMLLACSATALAGATERPRVADATRGIAFADPATRPLADAVAAGKVARIRELAPHSNLAARGDQDVTLLEWAIWNRRPRALAALLEAGADPSLPGMDGETVVHMAAMIEDPTYLEILLAHGAPVDVVRQGNGWTPLFRAVLHRRHAQREALVTAGADINHRDSTGRGLLHLAADDSATVLRLLELGVDPQARDNTGATFQRTFFRAPERVLNDRAKANRDRVRAWLRARGIAPEG